MAPVSPAIAVPRIKRQDFILAYIDTEGHGCALVISQAGQSQTNHDFVILRVSRQVSTIKIRRSTRKCIGVILAPKNVGGVTDIPRDAPKIFMF